MVGVQQMDNENSIGYHFGQIIRISSERMKVVFTERNLAVQCSLALMYHVLFIILSFVYMRSEDGTLFMWGLILAPVYLISTFVYNVKKHIPLQVLLVFTSAAAIEFVLNVTHIIPKDEGFVLGGFGQSLWCAYIVLQVIVLFLFTLIPYIVYNHKNTVAKAKTE